MASGSDPILSKDPTLYLILSRNLRDIALRAYCASDLAPPGMGGAHRAFPIRSLPFGNDNM
jgi:hypothetical protein